MKHLLFIAFLLILIFSCGTYTKQPVASHVLAVTLEGDTILVAVPEGKSSYHSHYVMRRNPHPMATPKKKRLSLLLKPHEKDAFHMACIHAICLFFENHPHKQRGWVPTELAEQWLYAWDRGEVNTKEDLFSLYENWRPNNLVFFGEDNE